MKLLTDIKLYYILLISLAFTMNVAASERETILETVKQQVKKIHWHTLSESDEWGFTIETLLDIGNGKLQQRIQRYDPNLKFAQQWQLLEQNKEKPSKAMLHEYAKTQTSIHESDPTINRENVEIVNLLTLALKENNLNYAIFSFKPRLPMFDNDVNKVFEGELYFNKGNNVVEKLSISASDSFSPGFSIEVDQYQMKINVSKLEQQLHVTQIESKKSGTIFIFRSFNETNIRKLSSFVVNKSLVAMQSGGVATIEANFVEPLKNNPRK